MLVDGGLAPSLPGYSCSTMYLGCAVEGSVACWLVDALAEIILKMPDRSLRAGKVWGGQPTSESGGPGKKPPAGHDGS